MPESGLGSALSTTRTKGNLLRILGVGFGIAVIVGDTIGSGILRTPGEIAARLVNSASILLVWLLGGIFALLSTLAVTELGTMLPKAGGWYVYSRRAFGEYGGFLAGCTDWFMQTVSVAFLAVAFGEFAAELQPALQGHVKVVGIAILGCLTLVNWVGLRTGSRTQELTSLAKACALIGFVVACFTLSPGVVSGSAPASTNVPVTNRNFLFAIVIALQAVIVTYDGWYAAIYFTEEDENPARNLPRSSIGGVLACTAIFLLVNVALIHVLPMEGFASSQMPVADAALAILGNRGKQIILLISLLTAITTINATLLVSPRILFAMARDGLMPRWTTTVNKGGTPSMALLIGTTIAVALVLRGSFGTLVAIASFLCVTVYLSGFVALFVLRVREPELARPFKMWGYPWTNLAVLVASAAFLIASVVADLKDALFTLVLIALSYPVYFIVIHKRGRSLPKAAAEIVTVNEGD
jgi:basic amino acid/polyamine antiporter, APA family